MLLQYHKCRNQAIPSSTVTCPILWARYWKRVILNLSSSFCVSSFCADSVCPIKWKPFNRIKIKLYGAEIVLYRNAVGYLRRAAELVYFLSTENEHLWTQVKRVQSPPVYTNGRIIWGLRSFPPGEEIHAKQTKQTLKGRWYLFHR